MTQQNPPQYLVIKTIRPPFPDTAEVVYTSYDIKVWCGPEGPIRVEEIWVCSNLIKDGKVVALGNTYVNALMHDCPIDLTAACAEYLKDVEWWKEQYRLTAESQNDK